MDSQKVVECPLLGTIDVGICFDVCMVSEGIAPKWTAPDEATSKPGFEDVCLECENHFD